MSADTPENSELTEDDVRAIIRDELNDQDEDGEEISRRDFGKAGMLAALGLGGAAGVGGRQVVKNAVEPAQAAHGGGSIGTESDPVGTIYAHDFGSSTEPIQNLYTTKQSSLDVGTLNADELLIGDSLGGDANLLAYLDSGTLRVVKDDGTTVTETTNIGQGLETAFSEAHSMAESDANNNGTPGTITFLIAPEFYDATDVTEIFLPAGPTDVDVKVLGHGVHLNQTLDNIGDFSLNGITVTDTPSGPGFRFHAGQETTHRHLTARRCATHGFLIGGESGAQVTNVHFDQCYSEDNGSHGVLIDGSFTDNWVNANTFTACTVRNHSAGDGIVTTGAASYNTFVGPQVENVQTGGYSVHVKGGKDNTFVGGHLVAQARFDAAKNYVLGGRWPNGFDETNGYIPFNISAGTPNPNDTAWMPFMVRDLSTVSGNLGGQVAVDDGTNTTSGNFELAVWDGSLNSGAGGWNTMGGDVI